MTPGPLSMDALLKYGAALGIAYRHDVFPPPPDSPKIITLAGSPPNAAMFRCTQRSPSTMSRTPLFPEPAYGFARHLVEIEEAEQAETMVGLHDDHVEVTREVRAVLPAASARSRHVAAAVAVEHHRTTASVRGGRPDVEHETILGRRRLVAARRLPSRLDRRRTESQRVSDARPRFERRGPTKAPVARDAAGVRDAAEDAHVAISQSRGPCRARFPRRRTPRRCDAIAPKPNNPGRERPARLAVASEAEERNCRREMRFIA